MEDGEIIHSTQPAHPIPIPQCMTQLTDSCFTAREVRLFGRDEQFQLLTLHSHQTFRAGEFAIQYFGRTLRISALWKAFPY
jgi:hypothetical protein